MKSSSVVRFGTLVVILQALLTSNNNSVEAKPDLFGEIFRIPYNPSQIGILAVAGAAVAATGIFALKAFNSGWPFRRKRDAHHNSSSLIVEILGRVHDTIIEADKDDCFQRLMCELSTRRDSAGWEKAAASAPMLTLVHLSRIVMADLSDDLQSFYRQLSTAAKDGKRTKNVKHCRKMFACPITGLEFDKLIGKFRKNP